MAAEELIDRAQEADSFRQTLAGLIRYRALLTNLVVKDLKLKYRGSFLGFIWSLANPLLMIGVYTIAFKYILGNRTEGFVFHLMLGILAWTFFSNSMVMASGAIVDNGGLVKSVFFPRAILPVATVLFNFAQYVLTLFVFLPLMLALYRVPLSWQMLLYPVFLALQMLFTIGMALLVATGTAFFRDVRHFLEIGLAALFWLTPIVYTLDQVSDRLRQPLLFSPMAPFIVAYQQILFYRQWPNLEIWLIATVYAGAAFSAGMAVMLRQEDKLPERI